MTNSHKLHLILHPLDERCIMLECDGLTRIISYILQIANVDHLVEIGSLHTKTGGAIPHFWIKLHDGYIIDYRARMWLGNDPKVPHGIFQSDDYQGEYTLLPEDVSAAGKLLAMIEGIDFESIAKQIIQENK